MFWRRARRIADPKRVEFLGRMYGQPEAARNFGIWTEAPARPAKPLVAAAPHLLDQEERRNTVLWPALFNAWPNWHWGMQPTGDCTRWMQQHLLDVLADVKDKIPTARHHSWHPAISKFAKTFTQ